MNDGLLDPFRHNAWATRRLIEICRDLTDEQLAATAPGAYGSIVATLAHLIRSEDGYRSILTDAPRRGRSGEAKPPPLDELERRADATARFWEEFLASPFDPDRTITREDEEGTHRIKAGVVVAQLLNHGTDHRTQILTILSTLGVEHPDLDGWDYGEATGRVVTTPPG